MKILGSETSLGIWTQDGDFMMTKSGNRLNDDLSELESKDVLLMDYIDTVTVAWT